MNNDFIQKIINRSNRTLIIWSVIGLIAVFALLVFNLRYLYNFFLGPFNAQPEQILQAESASKPLQYWVNLQGDELLNTGVQYVKTSDSGKETVEASYYAMVLGDRLLLVQLKGNQTAKNLPAQVTGYLAEISKDENEKILQDIEQSDPELKGRFLPFKLEAGDFRFGGFLGFAVGLVILVASLWGIFNFIMRLTDPSSHPIMKKLARFGPLEFVTNRIETELAVPHTTMGNLHLTNSWLVYADRVNLLATRYEDVVWVYKHILRQKSYGITVSKTFTAKVCDRFGARLDCVAGRKEESVDQMLDAICQRTPWAVMGYSNDLEKAWNKDRQGFLNAVARRKAGA